MRRDPRRVECGPAAGVRSAVGVVLLSLLAGCATRTAGVDQRLILPEGGARHEMAENQAFVFPAPQGNAPPAFPVGFGKDELPPTTLCATLVVEADGAVRDVAILDEPGCMDAGTQPLLASAVIDAVSAWRFTPPVFCTYPDAAARDRDWDGRGCPGEVVEIRPVAVTLAYAFTFEVRNGRARVGASRH